MRKRNVTVLLLGASLLFACEADELAPVSGFRGEECTDPSGNCDPDGYKLDSGVRVDDTGVVEDSGTTADSGDTTDAGSNLDSGVVPDSGVDAGTPDAGSPDSGPPPATFLNLSGTWQTRYLFDVSDYVLGIGNLANELDFIDQALQGNLDTGFALVDQLVMQILQNYIPSWVGTLIGALNDVANFLEEMEAKGVLNLSQDPPVQPSDPSTTIHGNESWQQMTVYIIDNCPLGRSDPTYPQCAQFNFNVVSNPQNVGPLDILVDVRNPFHGVLQAGVPEADFEFTNREVRVDIQKLILLILDIITDIATNGQYTSIQSALQAAIDCPGLAAQARDFAENDLGLGAAVGILVEASVTGACNNTIDGLIDAVGQISVRTDLFEIDHQRGHAVDQNPQDGQNRPEVLQHFNVQNTIEGNDLSGRWEGCPGAPGC